MFVFEPVCTVDLTHGALVNTDACFLSMFKNILFLHLLHQKQTESRQSQMIALTITTIWYSEMPVYAKNFQS